jgi:hypothetical protein
MSYVLDVLEAQWDASTHPYVVHIARPTGDRLTRYTTETSTHSSREDALDKVKGKVKGAFMDIRMYKHAGVKYDGDRVTDRGRLLFIASRRPNEPLKPEKDWHE